MRVLLAAIVVAVGTIDVAFAKNKCRDNKTWERKYTSGQPFLNCLMLSQMEAKKIRKLCKKKKKGSTRPGVEGAKMLTTKRACKGTCKRNRKNPLKRKCLLE